MAIEKITEKNGVTHTRETQREYRTDQGTFVPEGTLADLARALIAERTQKEVAAEMGTTQGRVSESVNGRNTAHAIQIINHFATDGEVKGELYRIPDSVFDQIDEAHWAAYTE